MGRIHRLSEQLVNQIAAGEVVERPASVVKELAENAVDAQATVVRVRLSQGGLAAISVADDGHGMGREDALLCLERHATSKLADAEGLSHIVTKGFRGEALPSIAAVSRFSLTSSEPGAATGTRVRVEGGGAPVVEEVAPAPGTRIEVDDLFFNTPARRKFLKRESTELLHCEEAVVRLALAHPEVGFFLDHGGRPLVVSPATGDLRERIGALLGPAVLPHLLPVDERRLGVAVTGMVASPEFTLPTAKALYAFVNGRYIRDRGVTSAVQRAFQDSLPPGRQPVAVLFIELDPRAVDVNVHPQKLEVRFADPRSVQEALVAGIGRALKAAPWRDAPSSPLGDAVHARYAMAVERFLSRAQDGALAPSPLPVPAAGEGTATAFGTARPSINEAPPPGYFGALRYLGELGRRFLVCEAPGGTLVLVDPLAVHERLALHGLLARHRAGALQAGAAALFSTTVSCGAQTGAVLAAAGALRELGVELEPFGGETIAVRRVPVELEGLGPDALAALLIELAAVLPTAGAAPGDEAVRGALRLLASHAVPAQLRSPGHDEVHRWLARLDEAEFGVPTRRRRVVVHELPLLELEARAR